jgi:hypothetical protein
LTALASAGTSSVAADAASDSEDEGGERRGRGAKKTKSASNFLSLELASAPRATRRSDGSAASGPKRRKSGGPAKAKRAKGETLDDIFSALGPPDGSGKTCRRTTKKGKKRAAVGPDGPKRASAPASSDRRNAHSIDDIFSGLL